MYTSRSPAKRGPERVAARFRGRWDQPAYKPGSVRPERSRAPTWRPFLWDGRCRPPRATNPGDWPGERACPSREGRAAPIRSCSRWGLPCRPRCRVRGALLPHPFTLTPDASGAVCSLWHCPWGRPRRTLSGTVSPWSPDFPPRTRMRPERPPGRLIRGQMGPHRRPGQGRRRMPPTERPVPRRSRITRSRYSPSKPTAPAAPSPSPSAGSRWRSRPATSRRPCSRPGADG
jgi:hypothetical protein